MDENLDYVDRAAPDNRAAKASVDLALHDLVGKLLGQPWYKIWGLSPEKAPDTSFTIGIDTAEVVRQKVEETAPYNVIKVKMGVEGDRELMLKHNRPCIVVVRLRFRGKRRDFAVPLRSNIAPNVPKDQYFALPPRPTTRPGCRHGIHYIKMFPITKAYQRRFRTEGSAYYETLQRIIDGNTKRIVSECQAYLDRYEREGRPRFAGDIDRIVGLLEGEK